MNIMDTINDLDSYIKALRHQDDSIYLKKDNLKVTIYSGGNIYLTDITNALKRGKTCTRISIQSDKMDHEEIETLIFDCNYNFKKLFDILNSLDISGNDSLNYKGLTIYKNFQKSIRVYSPFNLKFVKPLKKTPEKWTVGHTLKVLINDQFKDFRCDGIYTDDYAYDASCNYQEGEISDSKSFERNIIENPSGWWCCESGNRLTLNCHHFKNTSMIVNI